MICDDICTMRARDILAENLIALMDSRPDLDTFTKIIAAGGGSNGCLDRIRRRASGVGIDRLDRLAKVYGLEAWQLLRPRYMTPLFWHHIDAAMDAIRSQQPDAKAVAIALIPLKDGAVPTVNGVVPPKPRRGRKRKHVVGTNT